MVLKLMLLSHAQSHKYIPVADVLTEEQGIDAKFRTSSSKSSHIEAITERQVFHPTYTQVLLCGWPATVLSAHCIHAKNKNKITFKVILWDKLYWRVKSPIKQIQLMRFIPRALSIKVILEDHFYCQLVCNFLCSRPLCFFTELF